MDKTLCFTGYRPYKFPFKFRADDRDFVRFENFLIETIVSMANNGYTEFLSGAAMGFDLLAASEVLLLRDAGRTDIRLVCVVPFKEQSKDWDEGWQRLYNSVLKRADEVVVLSDDYYRGCYQKRNRYMIDRSSAVVTYFDGQQGGTKSTILYAQKKDRRIINIYEIMETEK